MASMISYFGCLRSNKPSEDNLPPGEYRWDGTKSFVENITQVKCPYTQLKVLFSHSLAVAYYVKIYGLRCHEVINDFIEELNSDIVHRFSRRYNREFSDSYLKIYNSLMSLVKFNRGGNWTDLDIKLVLEYLFDGTNTADRCPMVWDVGLKGTIIAFLCLMNKSVPEEFDTVTCPSTGLAYFNIGLDYTCKDKDRSARSKLVVRLNSVTMSNIVHGRHTEIDQLAGTVPLLALLSKFDLALTPFETVAGIMSNFCLHWDMGKFGLTLSHHLAYCMLRVCIYHSTLDLRGCNEGLYMEKSKYRHALFVAMIKFVDFCTKYRNLTVKDRNVTGMIFGQVASNKEQKESSDYLREVNAAPSVDSYDTFMSVMGHVPALESISLISQKPTLITAQTVNQETVATEATDGDNDENANADAGKQPSEGQAAEGDDTPTGEGNKSSDDDTSEPPATDDDGAEDLPSDDTTGEDDASNPAPEETNEPADGGSSDPGSSSNSAQPEATPTQTNVSDDKGVKFELVMPDSETVDSVIFREEMYKFLSNVLTNPPKCMSPQDIETLNTLRKFWLSCLSIETIKGIVGACIRLPKSIQNSIRKNTEQKNDRSN